MTTLRIGKGHDDSERRVDMRLPIEKTGLAVDVEDSFDRSKMIANVSFEDSSPLEPGGGARHGGDKVLEEPGAYSSKSLYLRALLLLVAGLTTAVSYMIIARGLPALLVPLVLLVSLGALYIFALFLVPSSNSRGLRSFAGIFKALVSAAFPDESSHRDGPGQAS
jgi:hypothetical protein